MKFIEANILNRELTNDEKNSLVNIIIVICTGALEKVFANQTEKLGIGPDYQPIINMKQESREAPLHSDVYRITPLIAGTERNQQRSLM